MTPDTATYSAHDADIRYTGDRQSRFRPVSMEGKLIDVSSGSLDRGESYIVAIAVSDAIEPDMAAELVLPDFDRIGDGLNETWVY
jgi:hypothetical protein